jgi:Ser/Thr protein kinase RdoA (MazF antagonist)
VQWTPGQRCRLSYRVERDREDRTFVAIDVGPTRWSQRDYRGDAHLAGLTAASDATLVADLLRPVVGQPIHSCRVQPVRYRPGARCVLQYDILTAAGATRYYAKVFAPDVFAHLAGVGTRVAAALRSAGQVPQVVAVWPEMATMVAEAVAGRSVSAVLGDSRVPVPDRVDISARLGGLLANFHALSGIPVPVRTAADQLRALRELGAPVRAIDAQLGDRFTGALDTLGRRTPVTDEPGVLTHGGFRPGQVIIDQAGRLTLLDLDGVRRGDAAQDLATALAHLSWQAIKHPAHDITLRQAETSFVSGYTRGGGAVDPARLRWWRAAATLQVAARRFRRLDVPDWTLIPQLLDRTEALLRTWSPGESRW